MKGMNKKMKKTLPLILGLTLLCCSMTACGNKDNSSNNSEAKTSETMNNSNETSGLNSATDEIGRAHV